MPVAAVSLSDPRLRAVGWAVVLGRRSGTSVHIIATASGVLPRPATVLDGEVFAIAKALELSEGVLDVTTDSRVACRQQKTAYVSRSTAPPGNLLGSTSQSIFDMD